MRCAKHLALPKLSIESIVRSDPKKQARGVENLEMTQILFQNPAKVPQKFRNFGTPCAEKCLHSKSVRCASLILLVITLRLLVKSEVRSDPNEYACGVESRDNAKLARKNCKISGILARHAHRF